MNDLEVVELILELERTGVEYGQYLMAGVFAYVISIFLLGQRMTRSMITVLSAIYTAYVGCMTAGVYFSFYRASQLAALVQDTNLIELVEGRSLELSAVGLTLFWAACFAASMFFVYLVRNHKLDEGST